MKPFPTVRLVVFGFLILFSFIVLCVGIQVSVNPVANISQDRTSLAFLKLDMVSPGARGMALVASIITLLIVVPLLFFNNSISNSSWDIFLHRVWLELCWTAMMSVLWLASATLVTLFSSFTELPNTPTFGMTCSNCFQAVLLKAFAWAAWFTIFGYFVALIGCFIASVAQGREYQDMVVDEVLVPKEITPFKEYPSPPLDSHPTAQGHDVPQGYLQHGYSSQPYPRPNWGSRPDVIDEERGVPPEAPSQR